MRTLKTVIRQVRCAGADLKLRLAHMSLCWFCRSAAHFLYFVLTSISDVILRQNENVNNHQLRNFKFSVYQHKTLPC